MKELEKQRMMENFKEVLANQNKFLKNIEKHVLRHHPAI